MESQKGTTLLTLPYFFVDPAFKSKVEAIKNKYKTKTKEDLKQKKI